ncbi:MAG: ABC transporter permease [Anaerolineales bacterium]|nr:ABC transporter permease [Anaerolineales bacterium]MBX3006020.1 ABC transporter permease [Anaerolineales bacterium]
MSSKRPFIQRIWPLLPGLAALLITTLLLMGMGTNPVDAYAAMWQGAFGSSARLYSVLAFLVPLLLAASGLLLTFKAGLWNIGIEGQIIMGAIAASWVALRVELPAGLQIPLELLAAMAGGGLWALLAGVLKTRGGVHEIFGGLALNNLAILFTNYLIAGPWQPPEGGSFRGTQTFGAHALLPLFDNSRLSLLSLALAVLAFAGVALLLTNSHWGLRLKALGKNARSAFLLGVSSQRELLLAMALCGALAGLGGGVRVLSWFDSLRQSISGGIGYLALMVVLLAGFRLVLTPLVAFFFSAVLNGSITLQLRTQLHSALGDILTGILVLLVLLFGNYERVRNALQKRRRAQHG